MYGQQNIKVKQYKKTICVMKMRDKLYNLLC